MATIVTLNTQYLNETESSNYFGGLNGETNDQIQAMRTIWIDEMANRGFEFGYVICDEDGEIDSQFDAAAQESIDTAGRAVFGTPIASDALPTDLTMAAIIRYCEGSEIALTDPVFVGTHGDSGEFFQVVRITGMTSPVGDRALKIEIRTA